LIAASAAAAILPRARRLLNRDPPQTTNGAHGGNGNSDSPPVPVACARGAWCTNVDVHLSGTRHPFRWLPKLNNR